jgi:hypothetical protein
MTTPGFRGLLAGVVLVMGSVSPTLAQGTKKPPTPQQMLDARLAPKHDDVSISTPSADELAGCTVTQVMGQSQGASGWVLLDAKKTPLRRFFDSTGRGNVDVWSYYKDGVEVYREFDTTHKGVPNNFRWLNSGGMKWGVGSVDARGKTVISGWRMISAEEVGFEAYQAMAKGDFQRLQNLFITAEELQALKLPAAKIKVIMAHQQAAAKKFAEVTKKLNLANYRIEDVESALAQCDTSSDVEIIKYSSRAVRYKINEKDRGWIYTGEMIQVGMAWKLIDVPSTDDTPPSTGGTTPNPNVATNSPELQKLLDELTKVDTIQPPMGGINEKSKAVHAHLHARITLVQQIIQLDKAENRDGWYRQLFDNLMAMAQNNCDEATLNLLKKLTDDVATRMPGSNLAAYGAYRYCWTDYSVGMAKAESVAVAERTKAITAVQDKWLDGLADFVKKYASADDTAEALYQLGNGSEFSGKTEQAKRYYTQLAESFPKHHLTPRAKGCVARLSLVGNSMALTAPTLNDGKLFDVSSLKGKIVIVHYWSSQSEQYMADFVALSRLMSGPNGKNVELVCVSLDDTAEKAKGAVQKASAPGIHLFQAPSNNAGGSNGPLAIQYGIHILPTVFVIGRDGKVVNNAVLMSDIELTLKSIQVQ